MKILMLSGIFAQTAEYRASHMAETPDSLLADGLADAGVDVTTAAPNFRGDWRDYDIVHLHHLTNACLRALLPHGKKIVFTHHASRRKPLHHELVKRAMERRADRLVVFTADEQRRLGGRVPADKVEIILSGLSVDYFTPHLRSRPAPGEPWNFLYVGQLVPFKRVDIMIDAIARLVDEGHDARLRIVSHRETLRPELEAQAAALGISDRIEYLGTRTRAGIGEEMRKHHFLLLSSHGEGFSTVTCEASLSGLPTHLFDVCGSEQQVPDGWERPHIDDVERFSSLLLERLETYDDDAARWYDLAPVVREEWSVDRMVREHIALYESLMD
jgi:glycosyltransferase involved in cell wall biosynthesis